MDLWFVRERTKIENVCSSYYTTIWFTDYTGEQLNCDSNNSPVKDGSFSHTVVTG
jgi:hypothetical protein